MKLPVVGFAAAALCASAAAAEGAVAVDCVGSWGRWSADGPSCGGVTMFRTFQITTQAQGQGKVCNFGHGDIESAVADKPCNPERLAAADRARATEEKPKPTEEKPKPVEEKPKPKPKPTEDTPKPKPKPKADATIKPKAQAVEKPKPKPTPKPVEQPKAKVSEQPESDDSNTADDSDEKQADETSEPSIVDRIKEILDKIPYVRELTKLEVTLSNAVIVFAVTLVVNAIFRRIFPGEKNLPPFYSPGIPVLGGFLAFTRDPLGTVRRAYRKHGDCFTLRMFHKKITFLVGPEAHLTFFKAVGKDYDVELDQASCYQFMTPVFGKGVVYDAPIQTRKQQFKFLSAALKAANLQNYPERIEEETRAFLKNNWGNEGEVDLLQAMQDLTILTASATLLGDEIRNALYEEVSRLYRTLDEGLSHLSVFFPNLPTEAHRRRDVARKEIVKIFSSVIQQRRKDLASGKKTSDDSKDLLQRLIESKYKDGRYLTDDEITGMIIATLFAGQHTTNVSITWAIHFLAHDQKRKNGDLLERFLEEVNTLKAQNEGEKLWKTLQKMKFGNACIKETVRLFPPLIFLMRAVVQKRVNAGRNKCTIPKGHTVMICNSVAMRLPEVFDNPDEYVPDRWMDDEKRMALARYSFVGFGGGTHSCMGESFAYMQIKTILSVLLNEYDMTPIGDFPKPDLAGMVVGPIGPTMMKYKRKVPLTNEELAALKAKAAKEQAAKAAKSGNSIRLDSVKLAAENSHLPVYTRAEVRRHCTEEDCWIIVDNGVYDVTEFFPNHPGGSEVLFAKAGEDCTKEFYGDQHPDTVPTTLEQFLVGLVADDIE